MKASIDSRTSWCVTPAVDPGLCGLVTVTVRSNDKVRAKCEDIHTGTDLGPAGKFKGRLIEIRHWRTREFVWRLFDADDVIVGTYALRGDAIIAAGSLAFIDWEDTL